MNDVKPMHCQNVLNKMADKYSTSTIKLTQTTLYAIFQSALENDVILKNPMIKSVRLTGVENTKSSKALTIDEQKRFVEFAKKYEYYNLFAFILQTGLRIGELTGIKWTDIDFSKKILYVNRNIDYDNELKKWVADTPKSRAGIRTIPLTQEAVNILRTQKEKNRQIKVIPIEFSDFVFLNANGRPIGRSNINSRVKKIAENLGIESFSIHTLRHTFATRCIEAGMKPKTLQQILGHSSINVTMDLYVHITEEEKTREIENAEKRLKLV